jgi:uncharacterized protein YbdZ (MbtH family)
MGSVGDGSDNAVTERFLATLAWLLDRSRLATCAPARTAVFDDLEGFDNPAATPSRPTSARPTSSGGTPPANLLPDPASSTVSTGPGQLQVLASATGRWCGWSDGAGVPAAGWAATTATGEPVAMVGPVTVAWSG